MTDTNLILRNFDAKIVLIFTLVAFAVVAYGPNLLEKSAPDNQQQIMQRFLCEFEVFGKVQGVFFRKYTKKQADTLNLTGWCMNTRDDTVKGELEGSEDNINQMKVWLERTGSPSSRISKAVFSQLKSISNSAYDSFTIRK